MCVCVYVYIFVLERVKKHKAEVIFKLYVCACENLHVKKVNHGGEFSALVYMCVSLSVYISVECVCVSYAHHIHTFHVFAHTCIYRMIYTDWHVYKYTGYVCIYVFPKTTTQP